MVENTNHREGAPGEPGPTESALGPGGAAVSPPDVGWRIGPYRLLERIGEGGFAVVYLAEQHEPVHRRVALKVIKPGMDSKAVIARFEAEKQALALMDHPNVAKVFDAGTTEQGRPYFVMEHVAGVPITEHCDRHRLNIEQRLDLFLQVCEAVQHAHQKGIIHRDIKPSNVLVAVQDERATPKVIDFGVAKAISQPLTEQTIFTEQGQLIGTPSYMSPEQAERTAQDVDTRADIYSLGVLLYELLTGSLPLDPASLRVAAFEELLRIIREVEPQKPSTRLSTVVAEPPGSPGAGVTEGESARAEARGSGGSSVQDIAHQRRADPRALVRDVRGDLDWITMKALEKDRTRRYASPLDFAADIQRHLNHEPVVAGPPSAAYRVKKFVRRNRAVAAASVVVFLVLVAGVVGTTSQALIATRQRDRAIEAERQQSRAREEAESAQAAEEEQRKLAEQREAEAVAAEELATRERDNAREALTAEAAAKAELTRTNAELDAALADAREARDAEAEQRERAEAEAERALAAEEAAETRANELEQVYFVAHLLSSEALHIERRWGMIEDELLRGGLMELTAADSARIAVRRAVVQLRLEQPSEAVEFLRDALAAWHKAWDDQRSVDVITLGLATLTMHALVQSDGNAIGDNARELIEHVVKAWRAIDAKYPDDYDRIGILIAGEALVSLGDDEAAESLLREAEQHLSETPRYRDWHARSLEALAGLLDRTGRQADAEEMRERQQRLRVEAEQEREAHPATIARSAAAEGKKLIAGGSPVKAIAALRQSLGAWHSAWGSRAVADLETLRSVTDSVLTIATEVPEAEKQDVVNVVQLVVEAWIGLRSKYPADFSHLGLISAGEALMALGEDTEARRLLEQSEGVLDASPRYKDWHCRNVGLLADVTARIGDRGAAAAWAEKLRAMAPPNEEQP